MNKRRAPKQESVFKTKGFYIALYSCVAVLLIAAIAITYTSLNEANDIGNPAAGITVNNKENPANAISPYVTPSDKVDAENGVKAEIADSASILANNTTEKASVPAASNESVKTEEKSFIGDPLPVEEKKTFTDAPSAQVSSQQDKPVTDNIVELKPVEETVQNEQPISEANTDETAPVMSVPETVYPEIIADPVFKTFDGEQDMLWPVLGEIVMDYSVSSLVYDKTLEHFRTNDNICIAANVDDVVKSAADGVVVKITKSREMGNTIVIEHGNGWSTTYSQLNDKTFVYTGDVVTAGQEIGTIAPPSIYSVALGNHLGFKVAKDEETVNPNMILVQN